MTDLPTQIESKDWTAFINVMPPGPATFHVQGTVALPDAGFEAHLEVARFQGINPTILLMDLVLTPSSTATETSVTVQYSDQKHTDFKLYHKVSILYRGRPHADADITTVC